MANPFQQELGPGLIGGEETPTRTRPAGSKYGDWGGVYTDFPAAMPKHHPGNHTGATGTTQSRMWLPFADEDAFKVYQEQLSQRSQNYVKALSTFLDGARGIGYLDFFLQGVNESYQEKVQVSEVLSDGYIAHFFGQRAPVWGYSGVVLNTAQDEWYDIWHILYQDVLRGTRLAEAGLPVRLAYDTRVVSGSMMNLTTSFQAANETYATFQFQLLVRDVKYSPSSLARPTEYTADNLGSDRFLGADQLVTGFYNGLSAARQDLRTEYNLLQKLRAGFNPEEVRSKTGIDTQEAVEQDEQLQSTLDQPASFSPRAPLPGPDSFVEGTGADVSSSATLPGGSTPIQ